MTPDKLALAVPDEAAMVALGARLGDLCNAPLVIYLEGDLGMGKTTLSRGLIQSLGHTGAVKSPTYTLVEPYELAKFTIYHFDLYRLGDPEELEFLGLRDYLQGRNVCVVEWPERAAGALPRADIDVIIQKVNEGRQVQLVSHTNQGAALLSGLP